MILGRSISRNALLLGAFAAITTAVIAAIFIQSEPVIKDNIRKAEQQALLEIFSEEQHDNSMLDDTIAVEDSDLLGLREPKKIYVARKQKKNVGVIIPATARDGYTGDIDLIVGVWSNGNIAGVRVLSHRETPGLGDAIDRKKSDWVDGFFDRSLQDPVTKLWKVKKDGGVFDQFTGATITPRAVTKAVKNTLIYFEQHRESLLKADSEKIDRGKSNNG